MYNKVYDITKFIDKHPGGDIVRLCAGRDGTDLMESYHPTTSQTKALHWLNEYYVGDLVLPSTDKSAAAGAAAAAAAASTGASLPPGTVVANSMPDDRFFRTVRERVEKKLREVGWGRHFYETLALTEVVVTVVLYFITSFLVSQQQSYWWAVAAGILTGRLGFIMHMGNHRAMSSNPKINTVVESIMDLIGGSSRIWSYEHAVAHHLTPNQLWTDNDCSIAEPYLRFHPNIPWKPIHRIQAPATIIAMTIGTAKWYISDIFHLIAGRVGSQSFAVSRADWIQLGFFKSFWFAFHILLPYFYTGSWKFAFLSALLLMAVSAHYLENIFIVNHIQDNLVPDPTLHWAAQQTMGSADWASGSHFWNFFSGGLNHQVVHHLFPSISHYCYPIIAPIVAQTCKEFGLPYHTYDSFPHAWIEMVKYLHRLGQPPSSPLHIAAATLAKPTPIPSVSATQGKAASKKIN